MGLSEYYAFNLWCFVFVYCLATFAASSNVKLKFYGVSKRDANASRQFPTVSVKECCRQYVDHDFVNLIPNVEPTLNLDEDKLLCNNINNISLISNNGNRKSALLSDLQGNLYDFYQYGSFSTNFRLTPCNNFKNRLKRQFEPLAPLFNNSNVIVNSIDSNITVTQLINITSGRSMVDVKESSVRLRINSEKSNVRLNPKDNFVNVSVTTPYVILNTSDRQSLDMTTSTSEIYVITQKGGQNYSIVADSGPSNMTVRQGKALVEALADTRSKISVQGYLPNVKDQILITSQVIDRTAYTRELIMTGLTSNVRTDIQLVRGLLSIIYDQVQIRVSAVDHEILIYTGVYTVRITTLLSPFAISVTDTIDVTVDNSTVSVFPDTSNITGKIPHSLMQLRPDNATNIQLQTEQQGSSALSNANIDVESSNLTLEVIPKAPRIYAVSIDSYAIINTSYSNIGVKANRSIIEVLSGNPYIRILTGNTSIEVRAGGKPFTLSPGGTVFTFPPIVTFPPVTLPTPGSSSFPTPGVSPSSQSGISGSSLSTLTNNGSTSPVSVVTQTAISGSSISAQTPNISSQGEGGSSISPIDLTRIILSSTVVSTSTLSLTSSSSQFAGSNSSLAGSSTISQSGAVSISTVSEATASQTVLNATISSLPSFNITTSSSSNASLPISEITTQNPLATGVTGGRTKPRNIYPFPFPVIIPWPIPATTTSVPPVSVSGITGTSTGANETSTVSVSRITGTVSSANETSTVSTPFTQTSLPVTGNVTRANETSAASTLSAQSGSPLTLSVSAVTTSSGNLSSGITVSLTGESVPTPPTFPVGLSTLTSGATVSHSCVTSSLNASSDIVCIEAEIVSIQVPPMNATSSVIAADTSATLLPSPANGTDQFVITQFSVATSPTSSVTLPLPNTAENVSTTPVILPEPPAFTVSPQGGVENVSQVRNTSEVLQNTLDVLQGSTQIVPTTATGNSSSTLPIALRELGFLNSPPSDAYMLSVAMKVKRSLDSSLTNFTNTVQNALRKAYIEGRNRQLGINSRRIIRQVNTVYLKQLNNSNATLNKFDEDKVEIRLISVDRPNSEEAKVRFYVVSDNNLVEAKKAKETFDQLGESELSAFLTYPVSEPVQALPNIEYVNTSTSTQWAATADSKTIVSVLVSVAALLLIFAIVGFILYKVKNHVPDVLRRKMSNASKASAVSVGAHDVKQMNHGQLKGTSGSDIKNLNGQKRILLGDLPPLPSVGPKLIKEYSDKDLLSYDNMSYSELFEYVNTSDQPVNIANKLLSPRGNKVAPLTPLSPSPGFNRWASPHSRPPNASHVTQVVRISPGTRRRLAKDLLDSSFPLANVNIEEVIRSKR